MRNFIKAMPQTVIQTSKRNYIASAVMHFMACSMNIWFDSSILSCSKPEEIDYLQLSVDTI